LQFKADGTFSYHKIAGCLELKPSDVAAVSLDGIQLTPASGEGSKTCANLTGIYDIGLAEGGVLQFSLVEDPCDQRSEALLAGTWSRLTDD